MKKTKPIKNIQVKINGVIYDNVYGLQDIKNFVQLFNEIHHPSMQIKIIEVKEEKKI